MTTITHNITVEPSLPQPEPVPNPYNKPGGMHGTLSRSRLVQGPPRELTMVDYDPMPLPTDEDEGA